MSLNQNIRKKFGGEGGIDAARPQLRLRRCLSRTGLSSATTLGEKNERPHKGAFDFSGGEGGIRTHDYTNNDNAFVTHRV